MEAAFSFAIPWNMVTYPTDAWARLVLGRPDAKGTDVLERFFAMEEGSRRCNESATLPGEALWHGGRLPGVGDPKHAGI